MLHAEGAYPLPQSGHALRGTLVNDRCRDLVALWFVPRCGVHSFGGLRHLLVIPSDHF
jgi:hypothetical protein